MNQSSRQLTLDLVLEREATFEHFVAGPNGALLKALRCAAVDHTAAWPLLTGPSGLGKTHLLNAACHAAADAGRRAMLLPGPMLDQFGPSLLSQLGQVDLLAIDDVDLRIGQADWDEALFHLFNRLRDQQSTLLLASSRDAAGLKPALPDLKSRLRWGLIFVIEPLDEAGRVQLLKRRARSKGIDLSDEVVAYLMRRAPRDAASLLNLLGQLERASLIEKRRITVPFLRSQFPQLRTR